MEEPKKQADVYLAVDLGAGSGRLMAGLYEETRIRLEEIHRFDNPPVEKGNSLRWDAGAIFDQILVGLQKAAAAHGNAIRGIGVDTWGVDYALLDPAGNLCADPHCYRDGRNQRVREKADQIMPPEDRYAITGIQRLPFNTLYQLLADRLEQPEIFRRAEKLLFMPDLFHYWLCGEMANEVTIASTGELLDARTGGLSAELLETFGIPPGLFCPLVEPGRVLGTLKPEWAERAGLPRIPVIATPSHDTAAAVAACPLVDENAIYISSGTWSLMGVETTEPSTARGTMEAGLTNERGVEGTIRLLQNIGGFWILQECLRDWESRGVRLTFEKLKTMAAAEEPGRMRIDPNDPAFIAPGNMLERVEERLLESGQQPDLSPGPLARAVFEGLARSYGEVREKLERITGRRYGVIHVIGGGSRNDFLNQLTADQTGCRVLAGPVECSSVGNLLAQLAADGRIDSIRGGRDLVRRSFAITEFLPRR